MNNHQDLKNGVLLTHRTTCRVIYGDTDNMGHAYHANYFRWFETGRTEMFRSLGLPYCEIERRGYFMPIAEVHCRFKKPVKYDDLLVIETSINSDFRAVLKFNYTISIDGESAIHAHGYTRHACIDRNGRVVRPPDFLVEAVNNT
jgi:acyl-CoA thioester hydrolase